MFLTLCFEPLPRQLQSVNKQTAKFNRNFLKRLVDSLYLISKTYFNLFFYISPCHWTCLYSSKPSATDVWCLLAMKLFKEEWKTFLLVVCQASGKPNPFNIKHSTPCGFERCQIKGKLDWSGIPVTSWRKLQCQQFKKLNITFLKCWKGKKYPKLQEQLCW